MGAAQITSYPFKINQHTLARNHSGFGKKKHMKKTLKGYSGSIPLDTSISITLFSEFQHLQTIQERPPTSNDTEKKQNLRWAAVRVGNKHAIFGLVTREVAWNTNNDIMGFQEYPLSATIPGKKALLLQIQAVKTVTDPPLDEVNHWVYWKQQHGLLRGTYEIKNNTIFASFDLFFSCEATWNLSSTMKQQLEVTNTVEEILHEIQRWRWYNILQGFAHPQVSGKVFQTTVRICMQCLQWSRALFHQWTVSHITLTFYQWDLAIRKRHWKFQDSKTTFHGTENTIAGRENTQGTQNII